MNASEKPMRASAQYDRLEAHLLNWARWMRTGGRAEFHVGAGNGLEGYKHYDTEGERFKSDQLSAVMVDTIIRDLKQMERDALNTEYLGAQWRNTDFAFTVALVLAREQVQIGINRKCMY